MTFRRSAPAALITAAAAIILVLTFVSNRLFSGMTDAVELGQYQLMQSIITSQLDAAASKALARADMIASLDQTRDYVRSRSEDLAAAREAFEAGIERDRTRR